jgi:PTH1 family peptidyl-tRNA hydrolase
MAIKLIVGLQNPGSNYKATRHNAGCWYVEMIAQKMHSSFTIDKKMKAAITNITCEQLSCKMILPTTFMNHSGLSVYLVSRFYCILPNEILVVHDELDLPVGSIKLKKGGGHGGHNGLRDIIAQLHSQDFYRLRVGIGHPGHKDEVLDYVLGKPCSNDKQQIMSAISRAIIIFPHIITGNIATAMTILHTENEI